MIASPLPSSDYVVVVVVVAAAVVVVTAAGVVVGAGAVDEAAVVDEATAVVEGDEPGGSVEAGDASVSAVGGVITMRSDFPVISTSNSHWLPSSAVAVHT